MGLAILDAVPNAIIIGVVSEDQSLQLIWFNLSARKLLKLNSMQGFETVDTITFDKNTQSKILYSANNYTTNKRVVVNFSTQAGVEKRGVITFNPFDLDGKMVTVGLIVEITDQDGSATLSEYQTTRQASVIDQLTQANLATQIKLLTQLNQEKSEVMRLVAHDLKNPLSSAHLVLSKIQRYHARMSKEQVHEAIQNTIATLNDMSDAISYLVQPEPNQSMHDLLDSTVEIVDANQSVREAVSQLKVIAAEKKVRITIIESPDKVDIAVAPIQLARVLNNLISNAIKFSCPDSLVTVHVERILNSVRIIVLDHGQGLIKEDFEHIFTKYGKLSAKPTSGESSSGLGLYISKKLTEAMGGTIEVSSPGRDKGSLFMVEFKIAHASAS